MKSLGQMDLEEWEIIPKEGLLEVHQDGAHNHSPQDHKDTPEKPLDDEDGDTSDHNQSVDMKVEPPKPNGIIMPAMASNNVDKNHGSIESSKEEDIVGGTNVWKRSLTGIGAVCSFGVAAAAICIIICGSHGKSKQPKQKLQIYASDKRMKQVVHYASKINDAIVGLSRGVPSARAQVTAGGYYDAAYA